MRLALYQPDIPQNTGSLIRLCACLDIGLDIIEPCGFPMDDRSLRRVGMDYVAAASMTRHRDYETFRAARGRVVLLSTKASMAYTAFRFREDDTVLVGRESAGVPAAVHDDADARLLIPMAPGRRSLHVALAAAMVLGEAARQTGRWSALEAGNARGDGQDDE